jgi:Glyoxalase-like domain
MHRSQLGGYIIDCQTGDLPAAGEFWSQALGLPTRASAESEARGYVILGTKPNQPYVEVQKVDHPSRVHLDIETDNVEAEVTRLEGLGAKRIKNVRSWVVMEAPTGQRFCIVTAVRTDFATDANVWN